MATPRQVTIDELKAQLLALRDDARELADAASPQRATTRPGPGRWSVAECLVHLTITAEEYRPSIEGAIEKGRAESIVAEGPFALGWAARLMVWSVEPPPRFRMPAPKLFKPEVGTDDEVADLDWARTFERYDAACANSLAMLDQAGALDLGRLVIVSPESKLVRMRLSTAFAFLAAHERRHLWQARRALVAPNGP